MNEKIQALEVQLKQLNTDPASDPLTKIKATNDLAWELRHIDPPRANKLCRHVQALLEKHPIPTEQARYQSVLAEIAVRQSDYQQGLLLGNAALQLANRLELDNLLPSLWATLGGAHWLLGNLAEALRHFEQQYQTARQVGNKVSEAAALNNLGLIYDESSEYELAWETYQQALKIHGTLQNPQEQALVLNNLAMNLYLTERYSLALEHALQALECAQISGQRSQELSILDTIGLIYTKQLDYPQALAYFQQCRDLAKRLAAKSGQYKSLLQIGRLYTLQRDDEAAISYLHQALQGLEELDNKKEVFECHQLLSEIYERLGDLAKALHHYKQFHVVKEQVFNAAADKKLRNLQISHEIEALKSEAEIHRLKNVELQAALEKVKQLSGLLPICASCKKIRDDQGYWHDVAVYVRDHSEAVFSHGMCPDCLEDFYAELARLRKEMDAR